MSMSCRNNGYLCAAGSKENAVCRRVLFGFNRDTVKCYFDTIGKFISALCFNGYAGIIVAIRGHFFNGRNISVIFVIGIYGAVYFVGVVFFDILNRFTCNFVLVFVCGSNLGGENGRVTFGIFQCCVDYVYTAYGFNIYGVVCQRFAEKDFAFISGKFIKVFRIFAFAWIEV